MEDFKNILGTFWRSDDFFVDFWPSVQHKSLSVYLCLLICLSNCNKPCVCPVVCVSISRYLFVWLHGSLYLCQHLSLLFYIHLEDWFLKNCTKLVQYVEFTKLIFGYLRWVRLLSLKVTDKNKHVSNHIKYQAI